MVVDASAALAILLEEDDADIFAEVLSDASAPAMSAVNYWEVLARAGVIFGPPAEAVVAEFVIKSALSIVPVDEALAREAARAFERYRGRPARLNLGACFAYALAMREGDGLLFKGNDFPNTDVKDALSLGAGPAG